MIPVHIEKLQRSHPLERFDCGREALNRFLIGFARQNQQAGASQTYVALANEDVAGYYTLVVSQVEYEHATERLKERTCPSSRAYDAAGPSRHRTSCQGKGLGSGLIKDAMMRTPQAADIAGIRAFAVHAKDDEARAFYERYDFVPLPSDPFHLFRLMKDGRAELKR